MTDAAERDELDTDAAAYLRGLAPGGAQDGDVAALRAQYAASSPGLCGPAEPVDDVHDEVVGGVPVRVYTPAGARGTTVWMHGGGWVVGSLDSHDPLCRALAVLSGASVVSVDYGLAPELRHPGQLGQVLAVLDALDPGPVALGGDSAGGHLAALAATYSGRRLAGLALVYPVVSPGLDTASARDNATGFGLSTAAMRWYWQQYLPDLPDDLDPPEAGVPADVLAADLTRLPPTFVLTAGKDPLRDEGLALADAVERAGVPVRRAPYRGQVHGFVRMAGVMGQGRAAQTAVARFLRDVLG